MCSCFSFFICSSAGWIECLESEQFHFTFHFSYTQTCFCTGLGFCVIRKYLVFEVKTIPDLNIFFPGFLARSYSFNIVDIFVHIIGAYVSARPLKQHRIFIRHAQDLILHNEALSQLWVTIGKYLFSRRR